MIGEFKYMVSDVLNKVYGFDIFINSTGFTIGVLLFMILLCIIYNKKWKSGTRTSALFFALMDLVFIPLIFEILSYASVCFIPIDVAHRKLIIDICFSCFIISSMFWLSIFTFYVVVLVAKNVFKKMLGDGDKQLKYRIIAYSLSFVSSVILGLILPYDIMYTGENGVLFFYGIACYFVNLFLILAFVLLCLVLFIYKKQIPNSYIVPFGVLFFLYILLLVLAFVTRYYSNNLPSFFGFLTAILFFTIESQDIQILEGYKKNKELEKQMIENKQKLLINMSHEVRTPLYNVTGYSEIIKNNHISDEEKLAYLENINSCAFSLKNIIVNIGDVADIQSNNSNVVLNNYDSKNLYLSINDFIIQNKKDNIMFTFNYNHNIPSVLSSDYDKVYKILSNIILNAYSCVEYGEVKLNIDGKKIDSSYYEITYTISNSGHVMTQELFDLDIEDYISNAKKIDYSKLGFIIAKKYIDMLGGDIKFINEPGKGTQYIIKLKEKIIDEFPVGNII